MVRGLPEAGGRAFGVVGMYVSRRCSRRCGLGAAAVQYLDGGAHVGHLSFGVDDADHVGEVGKHCFEASARPRRCRVPRRKIGDVAQVADDAPDRGIVDAVGRDELDVAPGSVGVRESHLNGYVLFARDLCADARRPERELGPRDARDRRSWCRGRCRADTQGVVVLTDSRTKGFRLR